MMLQHTQGSNQYDTRYAERHNELMVTPAVPLLDQANPGAIRRADTASRFKIAADPCAPPEILAALAEDSHPAVQREVASNRHTPPAALRHLCHSANRNIRINVAKNPSTPPEVLSELSLNPLTMLAVADNPKCPPEVLSWLWHNGVDKMTQAGIAATAHPTQDTTQTSTLIRNSLTCLLAVNPNCPAETLLLIAHDRDRRKLNIWEELRTVSAQINTYPDDDLNVAEAIADHPNCPPGLRQALNKLAP
jgi:hypothetical protein